MTSMRFRGEWLAMLCEINTIVHSDLRIFEDQKRGEAGI